jgi:ubiquinone/menaquinone biosynthesis C-methylase UbiE
VEGWLHAKHRLTDYHGFFVSRVKPGERVLDIGCGIGALAVDLAGRRGAVVTGLDADAAAIRVARAAHAAPGLTFVEGDAHRLPPMAASTSCARRCSGPARSGYWSGSRSSSGTGAFR